MALHDKLASKAISSGKGAADFSAAAQKHANATWFFLIVAGAIWYFLGWGWALIPVAIGIYTAVQSVSATMVATRIEKLKKISPIDKAEDITDEIMSIIQTYGKTLENYAPTPGCVADSSKLPYPKQEIKAALISGLQAIDDTQMKEHLKIAYIQLSDWQEGVGDTDQGIDLKNIDPNQSAEDLAKAITEQSSGKDWGAIVLKEQDALKQELKDLGLW